MLAKGWGGWLHPPSMMPTARPPPSINLKLHKESAAGVAPVGYPLQVMLPM